MQQQYNCAVIIVTKVTNAWPGPRHTQEKRIYGITEINGKITQARNKDEEDRRALRGVNYYRNAFDVAKWLDSKKLLSWLDMNDLFELVLGPNSHPEVVKRLEEAYRKDRTPSTRYKLAPYD